MTWLNKSSEGEWVKPGQTYTELKISFIQNSKSNKNIQNDRNIWWVTSVHET